MRPHPCVGHVGDDGLAALERAGEVHREQAVPRLEVDLQEGAEALDPGAVDEHGRRPQLLAHLLDAGVDLGPLGHVHRDAHGLAAGGDELGGCGRGAVGIAVEDPDRVPVGGQPLRDGQPDARGRARDDRNALGHWMGSSPAKVVRCMSRGEDGS